MFENEDLNLSPINFFQISLDCFKLKESFSNLTESKMKKYLLPDTSDLTMNESFAKVYMGWKLDGVECFVVVDEPVSSVSYPNVTKGDSVELFFDTRDVKTSGFNTKFCHHFYFLPEAIEDHMKGEITKFRTDDAHPLADPSDLSLKVKKTSKGYSMYIFIPKDVLHGFDPEQFDRLGFTYRINRSDGLPQEFSVKSEEYQIEQQPSLWGSLKLCES